MDIATTLDNVLSASENHPTAAVGLALVVVASLGTISLYLVWKISTGKSMDDKPTAKDLTDLQEPVFEIVRNELRNNIASQTKLTDAILEYAKETHETKIALVDTTAQIFRAVVSESTATRQAFEQELRPLVVAIEDNTQRVSDLLNFLKGGQEIPAEPVKKKRGRPRKNPENNQKAA